MNEMSSISTIDQKMAEMRIKNSELLKRHQEIEADRQFAVRSGATRTNVEIIKDKKIMRGTTKNRARTSANHQSIQDNQSERIQRQPVRRKIENSRTDVQPQRAQRIDYNRLKRERAQELNQQKQNNNSPNLELQQYLYPFQHSSENNNDVDEPAKAKRLVIVNNKADRIGSGRFNQQQRTQEHEQRKREERMRRCTIQTNGHSGGNGANEFHLDVPTMPIWQNAPVHVQLLPTNINNHHTGIDHLINTSGDQLDQPAYIHNFVYSPPAPTSPYNGNGTVYFAHPAPPPSSQALPPPSSSQTHFHPYHPARTFENSNRHQFHLPTFQTSPLFQPPLLSPTNQQQLDTSPTDLPPRFRHFKTSEHENKFSQQRPISGDFDRLHNSHDSSSSRFNHNNRFQNRPQSFYDFSSNNNNNTNNNVFRSTSNNRFQRTNTNNNNNNTNTSLPLSAYMNTDHSFDENEHLNNNHQHWGTSYNQRRRSIQQPQRTYHQDKHQFPLSSYDPRQYGFNNNNYQRRNISDTETNTNRRSIKNNRTNNNDNNNPNEIDLIEEWWEDNNSELVGTDQSKLNPDGKTTTTVNDSGNSSLSTSMNLKESVSDDFINPPSDVSTTDSIIIESLDKLQQQLKLEEAVDERLASNINDTTDTIVRQSNKEPTTYDTAHFMQWAKEKFREELAGRLTAQEIEQHDAMTSDDDEDQLTTNRIEKMDGLESDLKKKLTIDENLSKTNKSIVVE